MTQAAQIGVLGLGTMGGNLARNLAGKKLRVAVWNRTVPGVEEGVVPRFLAEHAEAGFTGAATLEELVRVVERPRRFFHSPNGEKAAMVSPNAL